MSVAEIFRTMEYGPAPETAELVNKWLDSHNRAFGPYIDGRFVDVDSKFEVFNPATGERIATVAQCGVEEIDRAVNAAKKAQRSWAKRSGFERAKVLYALARLIQRHSRLFAVLETIDNGKPIRESRDLDIPLAARHFYYHAGCAEAINDLLPGSEPVGVCGQIIPWNFPLLMLSWKIAPAIAAGNAVVLKPAELTPLTALLFAEICQQAGVPKGLVNIVTGDGETGRLIVEHPEIDKIAFTGSTEVGRIIRRATANTSKKLSLELGGKSPFIVLEDADLDSVVEGIVDAIWFNQGQVCCAGSRLLVQESVAEDLHRRLKRRMATLRVGNPLDKAIDIGAIVDGVQLDRIKSLVEQGQREGADLFQPDCTLPATGWFYPPTLLSSVEPASTVAQVEIFGPVLVSMTFRTPAEAVVLANNTVYGLAASVWTENVNVAHDLATKIKAGTIWINCTNLFDAASGFGGYRESGFGREGGLEGLHEYVRHAKFDRPKFRASAPSAPATVDRTHKLFIAGKQARPDSGYSFNVAGVDYALGNRKDVRNAVEAARNAAAGWAATSTFNRSQILYFLAENLQAERRAMELACDSSREVDETIETLFSIAGRADKFDGASHTVPLRALNYTSNEAIGVVGIVAPTPNALLDLVTLTAAAIAMGNTVVIVPSPANPAPGVELFRLIEMSDIPAGVVNILTGFHEDLVTTIAQHEDVDAVWCFQDAWAGAVRRESTSNLKQTWVDGELSAGIPEILRRAIQVKNTWVPYGA